MTSLYTLLQRCTVRIQHAKGHGTGFFVAPGFILTCAHVLKQGTSFQIEWQGHSLPGNIHASLSELDLALIRIEGTQHPCVLLKNDFELHDPLCSYGYSDDYPKGDTFTGVGEGISQGELHPLLKFKMTQVRPGMSGAPLLNIRTGAVSGIVRLSRDRESDLGGRATPANIILETFTDLSELQSSFHQQNQIWLNCQDEFIYRTQYLEAIHRRYSNISLPIISSEEVSLPSIFQPLRLRRNPLAAEDLYAGQRRLFIEEIGSASALDDESDSQHSSDSIVENGVEALRQSKGRSMVILGGPGTGKTTFLKSLLSNQALKALRHLEEPLPIFLSLPDFGRSGKSLREYITSEVQNMWINERFVQVLWNAVERGEALLCLDSLDEVEPRLRSRVIRDINEWGARKGCTYVVGSRFTEYKGGQLKPQYFVEWEMQPLTLSLRFKLAERLLIELYRLIPSVGTFSNEKLVNFIEALHIHKQASTWEVNPLLVSLTAVIFVRQGSLPANRAVLYMQVIDAILEAKEPDAIGRTQLFRVIAGLALELYQEKGRTFTLTDIQRILPKVRENHKEQWSTEDMIRRITSSGVLELVAHNIYGFFHQTFQEYFAAFELAQRLTSLDKTKQDETYNFVWRKRTYSRWTEVLRLMVGVLVQLQGRKGLLQAKQWLVHLFEQTTIGDGDPGDLGLSLVLVSLVEMAGISEQNIVEISQIEVQVASTWVQQLLDAARRSRSTREERLIALAQYIDQFRVDETIAIMTALVEALKDNDENVRTAASKTLKKLHDRLPLKALLLLHRSNERSRRYTIGILEVHKEKIPIEDIFFLLEDTDEYVQRTALEIFLSQGDRIPLQTLLAAFPSSHWVVQAAIVEVLGERQVTTCEPTLLAALRNRHWYVRRAAVEALGKREEDVVLDVLLDVLHDDNWEVRKQTVEVVKKARKDIPLQVWLTVLRDTNEKVRNAAVEALVVRKKSMSNDMFAEIFQDSDPNVRIAVIRILGKQEELSSIEMLLHAFSDENGAVRGAIVEVLGDLAEHAPVVPLVHALSDRDTNVRRKAIEALEKLGKKTPLEALLNALHDADDRVQETAIKALLSREETLPFDILCKAICDDNLFIQTRAMEMLTEKILNEGIPISACLSMLLSSELKMKSAAIRLLGKIGTKSAVGVLISQFKDARWYIRREIIDALSLQDEKAPVELFIDALHDSDRNVRRAAIEALGMQGKRVPIEPILNTLDDVDERVTRKAIEVLDANKKFIPIQLLLSKLRDIDWTTQRDVVEIVRWQGRSIPQKTLLEVLMYPPWNARHMAVQVIGAAREKACIEKICIALEDTNWQVRVAAVEALEKIGDNAHIGFLYNALGDKNERVKAAAVTALGMLEENAPEDMLLKMLGEKSSVIRNASINVFFNRKNFIPREELVEGVTNASLPIESRISALEVLSILGNQIPAEIFIRALQDEDSDVRRTAMNILMSRVEDVPVEVFYRTLEDMDDTIRTLTIKALGKRKASVSLDIFINALSDDDWDVREAAANVLIVQRERVPSEALLVHIENKHNDFDPTMKVLNALYESISVEELIESFSEIDQEIRLRAVEVLKMQTDTFISQLLVVTLLNVDNSMRTILVKMLGKYEGKAHVEALLNAVQANDVEVRLAIIKAFCKRSEKAALALLLKMLQDEDETVKIAAVEALGQREESASITALMATLHDKDGEVREAVIKVLGTKGEKIPIEVLIPCLSDAHIMVRRAAIRALQVQPERVPVEILLMALNNEDDYVRQNAIELIDRRGEIVLIEPLLELLGDPSDDVRNTALTVLRTLAPDILKEIVPEATAILEGRSNGYVIGALTQIFVADMIGAFGNPSEILFEKLAELLTWKSWQVRLNTVRALHQIHRNIPDSILKRLLELRHDTIRVVREAADDTLADILSLETGIEDD